MYIYIYVILHEKARMYTHYTCIRVGCCPGCVRVGDQGWRIATWHPRHWSHRSDHTRSYYSILYYIKFFILYHRTILYYILSLSQSLTRLFQPGFFLALRVPTAHRSWFEVRNAMMGIVCGNPLNLSCVARPGFFFLSRKTGRQLLHHNACVSS